MTENPTSVNAAAAQERAQSGTQDAVTPLEAAAIQENDPQASARKEQVDAAIESLRTECTRMDLVLDNSDLIQKATEIVDRRKPVRLDTGAHEVAAITPYYTPGEYIDAFLSKEDLEVLTAIDPVEPATNLLPMVVRRRLAIALQRAVQTSSRTNPSVNCRGIRQIFSAGDAFFCEYDNVSKVIRMTRTESSIGAGDKRADSIRKIAWVYDADMFEGVEKEAKSWAHQQQLWEDACKYVGVFPETSGYVAHRNPESKQWELINTSTGQKIESEVQLIDKEGQTHQYRFLTANGWPLLEPVDNQAKRDKLAQAIRNRSRNA